MPWDVMGCHAMPWDAVVDAMGCHGMSWDAMGCHGMPWDAMGCHGMPWDAMGCHVMGTHGDAMVDAIFVSLHPCQEKMKTLSLSLFPVPWRTIFGV
jgi:hypothetical protein